MIRLGVIGLSSGNGHPYSWSAICNGYNAEAMNKCPFPSIPKYLADQVWPDARLTDVEVTHIWTQDSAVSADVARASLIEHIVKSPLEMIGQIDGLLLARDDAENHLKFTAPFLQEGVPTYIDKVPALSQKALNRLLSLQKRPGLIFTGTPLKFARELQLDAAIRSEIGPVRHVFAMTPASWARYAVHIVEPALHLFPEAGPLVRHRTWSEGEARGLDATFDSGIQMHFASVGPASAPIALRVLGAASWKDLTFADSFFCFKTALGEFLAGVKAGNSTTDLALVRRTVDIIEKGLS